LYEDEPDDSFNTFERLHIADGEGSEEEEKAEIDSGA
jgi:hypothetical protein